LTGLALLTLLALRRLARALVPLLRSLATPLGLTLFPAILLRSLIALALRSLFLLTLGRLTCGLSFLPALRLALLLFLPALLRWAVLVAPARVLAPRGGLCLLAWGPPAAFLSPALLVLGCRHGNPRQ